MSWHMWGLAADVFLRGVPVLEVGRVADELGFRGVEVYPDRGFVHVDMRHDEVWRGERFKALVQGGQSTC